MSKRLFLQSSIYSIGVLFSFVAGLISYPILTKNLSIADYGTVALYTVTIGLMTSFMKFGLQHSIIRFHADLEYNVFISTITSVISKTLVASIIILFTLSLLAGFFTDLIIFKNQVLIILLASALLQAIQSLITNLFIAKEQSKTVTIFSIVYRFISLVFMLIAILYIEASALAFLISLLIADVIYVTLLFIWTRKKKYFNSCNRFSYNPSIAHSMMIFGVPMLGYELANMVHAFIDRFMIESFMGTESLGLYSASYNMASLVGSIVVGTVGTALVPIYLDTWKKHGKVATESLLSNVNNIFVLLLPAIIAGLYSISEPLMGVLATEEYKKVSYILPIVSAGVFIFGTSVIYAAGLQINKSTNKLFRYVLESAAINIVLNYILIPHYGLLAASINTVVSYLWMALRFYAEGRKTIHVKFNAFLIMRSTTYSLMMVIALSYIEMQSDIQNLLIRVLAGSVLYIALISIFEPYYRNELFKLIVQWLNSRRNSNS